MLAWSIHRLISNDFLISPNTTLRIVRVHHLSSKWFLGLILPTKILRSKFILNKSENFEPSIFLDNSEKIGSNFLVQLAGQISENNIKIFLVGSQPKIWLEIPGQDSPSSTITVFSTSIVFHWKSAS